MAISDIDIPAVPTDAAGLRRLQETIERESDFLTALTGELRKRIVGQQAMIDRLLVAFLTGGHILLEGVPGLAKTLTIKTLADAIHAKFQRIQFTPDLLPADLIGTMIFDPAAEQCSIASSRPMMTSGIGCTSDAATCHPYRRATNSAVASERSAEIPRGM